MKAIAMTLLALAFHATAQANSGFVTNPYLPYPPGCAVIPPMNSEGHLIAPAMMVFNQTLQVPNPSGEGIVPLGLRVYRNPCHEPNRSLIWFVFSMDGAQADSGVEIPLPFVTLHVPGHQYETPLRLTAQPGTWGLGEDIDRTDTLLSARRVGSPADPQSVDPTGARHWLFLLENRSPASPFWGVVDEVSPSAYNARLQLSVQHYWTEVTWNVVPVTVPATSELWHQSRTRLPLSGRLSGNWVFQGAADQGVMLSVSGRVPPGLSLAGPLEDQTMVIFIAHYTFDAQGNMLWLTGAAEFEQGIDEVTVPIENVTNGEFRGDKVADREIVGSVTIAAHSCNNLTFRYDYEQLGLGSGGKTMRRLFSLETAGYDCRDHEAKVATNR